MFGTFFLLRFFVDEPRLTALSQTMDEYCVKFKLETRRVLESVWSQEHGRLFEPRIISVVLKYLVNQRWKNTAMPSFVMWHQFQNLKERLELEDDPDSTGFKGQTTALCQSVGCPDPRFLHLLLQYGAKADMSVLFQAVKHDVSFVFDFCLQEPEVVRHINVVGDNLCTVLHIAVDQKSAYMTEALLAAKADPNVSEGDMENTCLHTAAGGGDTKQVQLLLDAKANLHAVNTFHRTAFHIACRSGHFGVARQLWRAGSDLHTNDAYGQSPLHAAVGPPGDHRNIVSLLLTCKAKVNHMDHFGNTPLTLAAEHVSYSFQYARLLMRRGAEPRTSNMYTKSPLEVAMDNGNTVLRNFLRAWLRK